MARVAIRMIAALVGLGLLAAGVSLAIASRRLNRTYAVPTPPIARATSAEALARGRRLYLTACASCHTEAGQPRPLGARLRNFPESFGTIYSTNLTSEPQLGIGARTDGDIARLLRYGVLPDGRYSWTMPRMKALGDEDVAALIGFLRSPDDLFAPSRPGAPPSRLSLLGRVALAFWAPVDTRADASIPVPPRGPTAAYGRYLATAIYGCVDCHTDGAVPLADKLAATNLLAGGFEFPDPRGDPVESTNLTPAASGIGGWTLVDFQRALLTGVNPQRFTVRPPMPIFRYSDPEETEAIFLYLQSVPKIERQTRTLQIREHPQRGAPPAELFAKLGCATCHGKGAPFRDRIQQAAGKSPGDIARAILHPEENNAGTQMPTFASLIDEQQALSLAHWLPESLRPSRLAQ